MKLREALTHQFTRHPVMVTESNIANLTTKYFMPDGTEIVPQVGDYIYIVGISEPIPHDPMIMTQIKMTLIHDRMIDAYDVLYTVQLPLNPMMPVLVPKPKD